MKPNYVIYNDKVISIGLFAEDDESDKKDLLHLGMRWLKPEACSKEKQAINLTNCMRGETDWFLLPVTFGYAVGRTLIQQKSADCGLTSYFNDDGYKRMINWLVEMEEITGAMGY